MMEVDFNKDLSGERRSLDEPSKFTLTRFRNSPYTRLFAWIISLFGLLQ